MSPGIGSPAGVVGSGVVTLMLLLLSTLPVSAQDDPLNVELTPFGAARFGGSADVRDSDDTLELDDSSSFGLILNWRHTGNTMWEVLYSKQDTEAEVSTAVPGEPPIDIELQVLQLGGTYQFEGDKTIPYLAATVGGTHARTRANGSESDTFWSGSIGVGVLIRPDSRVGLRLEARLYGTLARSSTDLFCSTGPEGGACAVRIDGNLLTQVETFAGVVIRF